MQPEIPSTGIAIIGLSCRFPGARTPEAFWEKLCAGYEAVQFLGADDLRAAGLDPALLQQPRYVNACIRLEDVDQFDAEFFGFSPREAELLDPQQRLFLECAWEALESAGCAPDRFPGAIGVYAGANTSHYAFNLYAHPEVRQTQGMFAISLGNDKDHLCPRTAYKLNLRGPAITVQTTCSTSLVAVCQACQSLLNYQCDVALAGGTSILLNQNGYFYQEDGIPSPDGHCRAFDAMAKGTVGGSGVGVVVLKRLDEALAQGDPIRAVIRGFAVNNDGAVKVGYTAPSPDGQAEVIGLALSMGEIDPETVTYVEAHGTGTPLGDPIEVTALTQAFRQAGARRRQYCALGSVKTNLGHCDPAAGVAGLIKTVLALEHGRLVPSLHFQQPNPNIEFAESPFYVNTEVREWNPGGGPRRAGVSSFGIGGTNAHVVLEEAPPRELSSASRPWQLLMLSAKSTAALDALTRNLVVWRQRHPTRPLADLAYTLHLGRNQFPHRRMLVCPADAEASTASAIEARAADPACSATGLAGSPRVAFLFSGQGSQHAHMAAELYRAERPFREALDECADLLRPHLDLDLREVLYPGSEAAEVTNDRLRQTRWAQPALFAVEYALARLWAAWGVVPQAMAGHSLGEYVAACLAGVFRLEEALELVAARGRLMQAQPAGRMLSVLLPETELEALLPAELSLAAVNAPGVCVVSGPGAAIDTFAEDLERRGIGCRPLHTSHAFHSAMMAPVMSAFAERVRSIALRPPQTPFLSNTTGTWITTEQATQPEYWVQHLRQPVRFASNVQALLQDPGTVLLEVGPGRALETLARQTAGASSGRCILHSLPHPKEPQSETQCVLNAVGRLWVAGQPVAGEAFYSGQRRQRVALPTYPFQRRRFWIEPPKTPPSTATVPAAQPTPERDPAGWFYRPVWEREPVLDPPTPQGADTPPLAWLLFADAAGLAEELERELRLTGNRVVRVDPADRFAEAGPDRYQLDPARSEDYRALFDDLARRGFAPDRILHLFGFSPGESEADAEAAPGRDERMGFQSVLRLAQAIAAGRASSTIQMGIVASHLHAVLGDDWVIPTKALVQGPCRVVPQEYPNLRCRTIDPGPLPEKPRFGEQVGASQGQRRGAPAAVGEPVDGDGPSSSERASLGPVAEFLIAELTRAPFASAVAWRQGGRWVQHFQPMPIGRPWGLPTRLRHRGVYLITGGLGQIGLELAEYLARYHQARLVLVGRSAFPERHDWDAARADRGDGAVAERIRRLRALEALGASVLVLRADAGNPDEMGGVLRRVALEYGGLNGVIHAAGYASAQSTQAFAEADPAFCEAHFRPKVAGVRVLAGLLEGQPLDFVLLMSSLSAILGGLGFVAYGAANAFLDAFAARQNRRQFTPWISVNWDGWDFSAAPDPSMTSGGAGKYLRPAEGVEAFRRVLSRLPGQVAVSVTPLQPRLEQWIELTTVPERAEPGPTETIALHPRPELSTPYQAPRNPTEAAMVEVWESLLGIKPIGIHDNYFELGGHSLLAIQMITRLRDRLPVPLSVQALFETPTVAQLAERVESPSPAAAPEASRLADLLARIEQLSEAEVKALLEREDREALEAVLRDPERPAP